MVVNVSDLPGPDTATKQQAACTCDRRLSQMLAVAAEVRWPMCWTDDLYRHDRAKLAEHPGETVLWILRETGTHLYPVRCENFHEADSYRRTIHYWSGDHRLNWTDDPAERARYYLVTNSQITSLTWQQACDVFLYPSRQSAA